jgi:hypothetical protein
MKSRIKIFVTSGFVIGFMALFAFNVFSQGKNTDATPKEETMEMSCCDTEMMEMMNDHMNDMKGMMKDKNEMNKKEDKKESDVINE